MEDLYFLETNLKAGVDVNKVITNTSSYQTVLSHHAAFHWIEFLVAMLIKYGADVEMKLAH